MKKDKNKLFIPLNFSPRVKWVKRAGLWCVTRWVEGKQKVEWFNEKSDMSSFVKNEVTAGVR